MPRSVNHVASRARRKKILNQTKGFIGPRKNVYTVAKNILEKGGRRDHEELFEAFRGREPKIDALIERCGFKK